MQEAVAAWNASAPPPADAERVHGGCGGTYMAVPLASALTGEHAARVPNVFESRAWTLTL